MTRSPVFDEQFQAHFKYAHGNVTVWEGLANCVLNLSYGGVHTFNVPKGFVLTGEFRVPATGEVFLQFSYEEDCMVATVSNGSQRKPFFIVKKKKTKRVPETVQVIWKSVPERVKAGEFVWDVKKSALVEAGNDWPGYYDENYRKVGIVWQEVEND